ncbi:hypothetical protein QWZ14_07595 [Paeniroseomonas aquatica]|uniref:Uncharacterized protein n=2 Tax=Paeniroseomonas aquatica TaxID=373043 RepID=A0ABT8A3E5_9PROT|nr:hypothetical protein [Paeniroseomonas aquatica]MDN3564229.1 hypothetical protein [Paeniroseomonas aquatica]
MPTPSVGHPYLDIFSASLVPFMPRGPGHDHDPPSPHLLPLPPGSEEARHLLELLLGADHALRDDHGRVAALNLALAETQLRLLISHEGLTPARETVLSGLRLAKEELAAGQPRRAMAALGGAVRAAQAPPPRRA